MHGKRGAADLDPARVCRDAPDDFRRDVAPARLEVNQLAQQQGVPVLRETLVDDEVPQLWLAEVVGLDHLLEGGLDVPHVYECEHHLALVSEPLEEEHDLRGETLALAQLEHCGCVVARGLLEEVQEQSRVELHVQARLQRVEVARELRVDLEHLVQEEVQQLLLLAQLQLVHDLLHCELRLLHQPRQLGLLLCPTSLAMAINDGHGKSPAQQRCCLHTKFEDNLSDLSVYSASDRQNSLKMFLK